MNPVTDPVDGLENIYGLWICEREIMYSHSESVKVKVSQSCLPLCGPMDYRVHGILQARILEWVAIPFSRGSSQPGDGSRSPTVQADS